MLKYAIPGLHVRRSSLSEAFYRRVGFERRFAYRPDPNRDDPCYFGMVREQAWLRLSSFSGDGVPGNVVYFGAANVDALFAEFQAQGVPIRMPPTNQTWGNREMYVADPDDNSLRFTQELSTSTISQ